MTPYEVADIIDKEPLIASLLYDIDLLPEQIKEGDSRCYSYMLAVIGHMQAALKAREAAQSASGAWVPMKERQPADFERVLCVNSNGYMATANRFHDTGLGSWNGSDYTAEEYHELVIGDITHWMPLPAAPVASTTKREGP